MTIDALAGGGRVILGIGVSGPQIVEGWYGQPWGMPNARLRDYVTIVRKVLDREEPVAHEGPEISLPYRGPGRPRPGQGAEVDPAPRRRASRSGSRRAATATPSWPPSCATAGCRWAWAPTAWTTTALCSPRRSRSARRCGARRGDGRVRGLHRRARSTITDDVQAVLDGMRPLTAMYVGGMGSVDAQLPPRRDGPARLPRSRGAHPGAVARGPQGRGRSRPSPTSTSSRPRWLGSPERIRQRLGARRSRPRRRHRRDRRHRAARGARPDGRPRRNAGPRSERVRRASSHDLILVDAPAEHVRPHHAQPAREAQRDLHAAAGRAARRAARARQRPRRAGHDRARRRPVLLVGLRPRRRCR